MKDGYRSQLAGLLCYVRPHRRILILSFFMSLLGTAMGLAQPLLAKFLIDRVLLGRRFDWLLPLLALVIALLILGFVLRAANSYLYTRYSARVLFKMRQDLFDHLHRVPLDVLSKKKLGDIYSRLGSDMAEIQALLTETLPGLVFNFLTVLFTGGVLLWLNWPMALLSLCGLPPALALIHRLRPNVVDISRRIAEKNADIAHFLFESLAGTSVIRTFAAEKLEATRLAEHHDGQLTLIMRSRILSGFSGAVPVLFTILNMLVIYGYGGTAVQHGALSIGGLVAFAFYQGRVFGPLQGLMDGFLALQTCRVALGRVAELWRVQPVYQDPSGIVVEKQKIEGVLAFDDVSFSFGVDTPLFRRISFRIPARQVTAIVGASGVGKTTLCHLMTRLFDPDDGRITLDGIDIRHIDLAFLRRQVALVSQETFLFHTSILENLKFGKPSATLAEIIGAAEAAGIHEFIQSLPDGYHTVVGDRGVRLSGGQKQRISIARSLLMDPTVLILDEPTAFLDSSCEERLQQTFEQLIRGKTIVLVSHRASTIRMAQWIVAFHEGDVVYAGPLSGFSADFESGFLTGEALPARAAADRVPPGF